MRKNISNFLYTYTSFSFFCRMSTDPSLSDVLKAIQSTADELRNTIKELDNSVNSRIENSRADLEEFVERKFATTQKAQRAEFRKWMHSEIEDRLAEIGPLGQQSDSPPLPTPTRERREEIRLGKQPVRGRSTLNPETPAKNHSDWVPQNPSDLSTGPRRVNGSSEEDLESDHHQPVVLILLTLMMMK